MCLKRSATIDLMGNITGSLTPSFFEKLACSNVNFKNRFKFTLITDLFLKLS